MCNNKTDITRFNCCVNETDALYHEFALRMNMSDSVLNILYTLCEKGGECNQSDIYKPVGISRQTINSSIHKLEESGIVALKPGDGKKKIVFLTPKGELTVNKTVKPLIDAENAVFDKWTKKEREQLITLAKKYLNDIKSQTENLWREL